MDHAQVLAAATEVVSASLKAPEAPVPGQPAAAPVAPPAAPPTIEEAIAPPAEAAPEAPAVEGEPPAAEQTPVETGEPPETIGAEEWLAKVTEGDPSVSPETDAKLKAEILGMLKLDDDPKNNEQIWGKVLQTSRGKALFNHVLKAARDGKLPSADDIDNYRKLQLERAEMTEHFAHGTPEERQGVLQWLFVDRDTGQPYDGALETAQQLPHTIYRASPQIYEAAERAFAHQIVDYARAMFQRTGDASWKAIHENMQFAYLTPGKFTPIDAEAQPASNGHQNGHAAAPPEVQQELEQLRRERQFSRQQAIHQRLETFHQSLDGGRRDTIERLVFGPQQNGKAWTPAPAEREAHTLLLSEKLRQALDSDQNFQREFELKRREALRTGSPQAREAATQFYAQHAENKLKAHVWPEYRKGLRPPSADTRDQSQQRHATLQQAQQLKQPGAGGTPVPAAATTPAGRQPGEDRTQWIRRVAEQETRAAMAS